MRGQFIVIHCARHFKTLSHVCKNVNITRPVVAGKQRIHVKQEPFNQETNVLKKMATPVQQANSPASRSNKGSVVFKSWFLPLTKVNTMSCKTNVVHPIRALRLKEADASLEAWQK